MAYAFSKLFNVVSKEHSTLIFELYPWEDRHRVDLSLRFEIWSYLLSVKDSSEYLRSFSTV